ncbi:uncharacterized protein LOC8083154 isoform X2 [Sorghum bicolor]|uniref:F-box domain-containing protein n=1 Tax=Sorghum bicolor TaxID=4558 RepID=A0A1B6PTF3_SORBI|nr:uncharacterized protein LOC8083154 isoform X2 [Sorghum bicolor]KXG28946.2 hypothetical protein SORBI_3005G132600 [Sorghum bicolor]|eukprot:XP_021316695.1 uncharacterized protein LOC8083154 isoform X2 [Sorghum bicolor]
MSITTRSAAPGHEGDGSTCSATQVQASTCQEVDDSDCAEISASQVQLPEDILHRIHALMEMQDAAQAACVSRSFLRSWRCYPNLNLSILSLGIKHDDTLCIKRNASKRHETVMEFVSRVDHILQNHSGMGVKTFSLQTYPCSDLHPSYVDRWLQVAFTSRIENFHLSMIEGQDIKYNFPCSVFSIVQRSSIQSFSLSVCSFHSAPQVGCMSSLTNLKLSSVHVTGEELYGFLSNSCALKQIYLSNCEDIICLRIPCLLKELNILIVFSCLNLEVIESNAPNLSIFSYVGDQIRISFGHAPQVREVTFHNYDSPGALYYARTKLPFIIPNVQSLDLLTGDETANTPMTYGRFLQLKYLEIVACAPIFTPDYDFCSLVSFLDASPALETFILRVLIPHVHSAFQNVAMTT